VVDAADVIIFVGCRAGSVTTERWRHPAPEQARIIHIDVDPAVPGRNYKVDVPLIGDAKLALSALSEALGHLHREGDLSPVDAKKRAKFEKFEALAKSTDSPIKPERVVFELSRLLDPDAILVADPGTPCPYFSAYHVVRGAGRRYFSNRAHGALGYALAAAIGAHIGRPNVKTVAVMGDGSFGMCAGELETVVRLKLPITFVVIANAVYGWIKAGQRSGYGERYFSVDFGATDHAAVAAAFGMTSWRVTDPGQLQPILRQAFAAGEPTLVDVVCQPLHEARAPVSEWVA
jgi:acetolactate synthase-1/2/3 large subunit